MKLSYATFLLTVVLTSVILYYANADPKVKGTSDAKPDTSSEEKFKDNNSVDEKVDLVKKSEDGNLRKDKSSKQLGSKDTEDFPKRVKNNVAKDEKKGKDGVDSKVEKSTAVRKEDEKCDSSSNSCTDKNLVACLRVPGNDSPELSLLIQNKGKEPLRVTISAPDFVELQEKKLHLQAKDVVEVKVLLKDVGTGQFINLTTEHGNCSVDIRDPLAHSRRITDHSSQFTSIHLFRLKPSIAFLFLFALLIVASVSICINCRKWIFVKGSTKYQRLDMELPVSSGGKAEIGSNEGWDDSWGDSWDDEEAPQTPSVSVTPSFSSRGMASRRLNKEGWED